MEPRVDREHPGLGDPQHERAAFCLWCGGPLHSRTLFGRDRAACARCGFVLFRTPAAAVATVVARQREVLLVQRGIEPFRGCWGFPAGYQEYGESPADAAVRETREETGLEVRIQRLLDVCYTMDDPRKRANLVVYLAEPVAGTLCAADDAADAAFFALDRLPQQIAFANNRNLLARLRAEFPTGDLR
jgi:ADP-ribose pyrophosphatase YjhB (NUDIX family)